MPANATLMLKDYELSNLNSHPLRFRLWNLLKLSGVLLAGLGHSTGLVPALRTGLVCDENADRFRSMASRHGRWAGHPRLGWLA